MAVNLQDPHYKLHGDPKQFPRYATHAWRNGFSDCAGIVQRSSGSGLQRVMWDGSFQPAIDAGTDLDAWISDMMGRARQVSGLAIAALLHEHNQGK
jgi:hypothetical protein